MVRSLLAALMIFTTACPAADAFDAAPPDVATNRRVVPKNVELDARGALKFAFVDSVGRHRKDVKATVIADGKAANYQPNSKGQFLVPIAKPGIVIVVDGDYTYGCRVWKQGTAPPKSLTSIAFVQKTDAVAEVRGNALGAALQSTQRLYGLAILGLGGVALWKALDRDDAS